MSVICLTACHNHCMFCHFRLNINVLNTVILVLASLSLWSCVSPQSAGGDQGIMGQVNWVEGNLMPTIGDTIYHARAKGKGIQREILILNAVKADNLSMGNNGLYTQLPGKIVAKVQSDEGGNFKSNLPAGTYSVFTKEEGGFFANIYDGDNYINPVTVQKGIFTEIVIVINYKAVY